MEARIRNKQLREQSRQENPQFTGGCPSADNSFNFTRAQVMEGLIDKTLKDYASAIQPRDRQCLATALDRLYQTYADMTGHERRAVSRGTKRRAALSLYQT